jgi:phosphoglucosamine mutase
MSDAVARYVDVLARGLGSVISGPDVVVDTANGAAFLAAPELFRRVGASVEFVNTSPDGMNINRDCGATHPEAVAERSAGRVGLAFDGDADRLIAVDEDGRIANGDVIMAIFAAWMQERGELAHETVVVTVMSNLGFHKAMERLGINVIETRVGDRYVLEAMRSSNAVVGGEQSGHVLLEDRATGDGLRSALRLMEVMAGTGKELRELRTIMDEYPQVLNNVRVTGKKTFDDNDAIVGAIRDGERTLAGRGRILVRASGTEPLIRVMVEAPSEEEAGDVAAAIAGVVESELG